MQVLSQTTEPHLLPRRLAQTGPARRDQSCKRRQYQSPVRHCSLFELPAWRMIYSDSRSVLDRSCLQAAPKRLLQVPGTSVRWAGRLRVVCAGDSHPPGPGESRASRVFDLFGRARSGSHQCSIPPGSHAGAARIGDCAGSGFTVKRIRFLPPHSSASFHPGLSTQIQRAPLRPSSSTLLFREE